MMEWAWACLLALAAAGSGANVLAKIICCGGETAAGPSPVIYSLLDLRLSDDLARLSDSMPASVFSFADAKAWRDGNRAYLMPWVEDG